MYAARILALRWKPVVKAQMCRNLSASTDEELKVALDARCRSLVPGIDAESLTSLFTSVRLGTHTRKEVNRIGLRTLLWSGILGDQDPALQWEYAARGRLSERRICETGPRPMVMLHYEQSGWSEHMEQQLLAYLILAALRIYEEIGGNPVEAIPEEDSWRTL